MRDMNNEIIARLKLSPWLNFPWPFPSRNDNE